MERQRSDTEDSGRLTGSRKPSPVGLGPSGFDPERLCDAIRLAAEFHARQVDKGGQPYIFHPLRVMLAVRGQDSQIAAVLHDTVEDTGLELGLIKRRFGATVAGAVDALTRRDGESYADFIERCGANEIARSVKLADLDDNLDVSRLGREPTIEDAQRCSKYNEAKNRLHAIAMETRRAETVEQGSVAKPWQRGPLGIAHKEAP